ncbi:MAG: metallophosphoesterase [Halobacteriales archaeon]|nr:metallophosphoesterase [Halobacteriales archaeon]
MRLLVTSDTHADKPDDLPPSLVAAVEEADAVVHAGDFTSRSVLENFEDRATLHAVHGNADSTEVCDALPRRTVFEADGVRVCVLHGHDATDTAYEAAETGAHIVVRGHTHTPLYREYTVPVLNPGSPTRPRGSSSSYYAWLVCEEEQYSGRIVTLDGETLVEFGEEL